MDSPPTLSPDAAEFVTFGWITARHAYRAVNNNAENREEDLLDAIADDSAFYGPPESPIRGLGPNYAEAWRQMHARHP